MKAREGLLRYLESFFEQYLTKTSNSSKRTIAAYRDSLKLFICFVADSRRRVSVDRLSLNDISVDNVEAFLDHLRSDRANGPTTQNCRLAAIRSFCKHLVRDDLSRAGQYKRILSIPMQRVPRPLTTHLDPGEAAAILQQPDRITKLGFRDFALMLLLYNTGVRISEALTVTRDRCHLVRPLQVHIKGKGRKDRLCALWPVTADALGVLCERFDIGPEEAVFRCVRGRPLGYHGAANLIKKHAAAAGKDRLSLSKKTVTSHVFRHSVGYALVQAGVNLPSIRDVLGHESCTTTDRYSKTNMETQRKTLDEFWKHSGLPAPKNPIWKPKPDLLSFLDSL